MMVWRGDRMGWNRWQYCWCDGWFERGGVDWVLLVLDLADWDCVLSRGSWWRSGFASLWVLRIDCKLCREADEPGGGTGDDAW